MILPFAIEFAILLVGAIHGACAAAVGRAGACSRRLPDTSVVNKGQHFLRKIHSFRNDIYNTAVNQKTKFQKIIFCLPR